MMPNRLMVKSGQLSTLTEAPLKAFHVFEQDNKREDEGRDFVYKKRKQDHMEISSTSKLCSTHLESMYTDD